VERRWRTGTRRRWHGRGDRFIGDLEELSAVAGTGSSVTSRSCARIRSARFKISSRRRQPIPGPAGRLKGLPGLWLLSETIGDDNGYGGIVPEAEMTATHFNVLAEVARRQQRRAPADDGVAPAVHRCRRDVSRWVVPTEGTSERDDRAHGVGSTSGQLDRVDAAEAPSDQARWAVLIHSCEKLIETVGDMATEAAVGSEAPSAAAVTKTIDEPANWRSRCIVGAQSGKHQHGVAVATGRERQERARDHRKRGELGYRSSFPSYHRLPLNTLRHA
jgi:hypothetical protein